MPRQERSKIESSSLQRRGGVGGGGVDRGLGLRCRRTMGPFSIIRRKPLVYVYTAKR